MKQSIFFNKTFAIFLTIVIIALSFALGGARSLNGVRDKAVAVFESGDKSIGNNISNFVGGIVNFFTGDNENKIESTDGILECVRNKADVSQTVIILAEKYIVSGDYDVVKLKNAALNVKGTKSPYKIFDFNLAMDEAVSVLSKKLENEEITDIEKRNLELAVSQMTGYRNVMSLDKYNKMASDYNKKLEKIPANFIKAARLVKELPVF